MTTTTYGNGNYRAEVVGQEFQYSAKDTPAFFLHFRILGRYGAEGSLEECPSYKRTYRQYLANDFGFGILKADLRSLGVEFTSFEQINPLTPGHTSLVGRKIDVVCEVDTYKGRPTERWTIRRSVKRMSRDDVRALDDKFGHLLGDGNGAAKPAPGVTRPNNADAF